MTFRIGILGAGNISETHTRAVQQIPHAQVVAVYGDNPEKAASLAERCGATAYRQLEDFVRHRPLDVVLIGSPSGLHAEHARLAAQHGLHVLVEKPLDVTSQRIDALLNVCEQNRVQLGVFFQDRAAPHLQWLRRQIATGALGRIILVSARVKWFRPPDYYSRSRWRGTCALDGGGALINQGIHTVDLLLWLLGDITRVSARTRTALHAIEVEDTAIAWLEFASGALGTLEATTAAYPGFPRRVELTGSEGTVFVENDRVVFQQLRNGVSDPLPQIDGGEDQTAATVSDVRGHRAVLEDFLDSLATGAPPLCDGREGRRSVALVEAIYRSARTNQQVSARPAGGDPEKLEATRPVGGPSGIPAS
jgi:UDP-N-acetyl-2-amino-2-deoxyglucuronate dehydrogenase